MTDLSHLRGATIAFDLDGTLVESAPDLVAAVNAVLVAQGCRPLVYQDARRCISRGARWLLHSGFVAADTHAADARTAACFAQFLAHYAAHIADQSLPFPGAIDALKALRTCSRSFRGRVGAQSG